ncbi:AbrB/MazE/SpoVT family DNA-binding domain-containing protein [Candidatus Bathyarchaeota archaeon]|nr:AbrB/MazE/SpoVT family DNA-binding domain-containing protein [Candidatus Bathyarchaeota archaeon]
MEEVVVDSKGRILIPKELRDKVGLKPGSGARLEEKDGRIIITPPLSPQAFIREMEGFISEGEPTDDPLKAKRIWEK